MREGQRHSRNRAPAARRRGLTLIELLLVMALIGLVVGGGLGVFAALDLGKNQALGLVKNTVRAAQNTAIAQETPARVRLELAEGRLWAEALMVIGTWHFEDEDLAGSFGIGGVLRGADLTEDGYLGRALHFDGRTPGALARLAVHERPSFQLRHGFAVECAVRREATGAATLVSVDEVVGLQVTRYGALRGWFYPEIEDETGFRGTGPRVVVESEPGLVPLDRWVRLAVVYDRRELSIFQDGVRLASVAEEAPVFAIDGPLEVGDRHQAFAGRIDDLVISAVETGEETELPDGVVFASDSAADVRFDAGGGLDRRHHRGPVVIGLIYEDGTRVDVNVGIYGTVDG